MYSSTPVTCCAHCYCAKAALSGCSRTHRMEAFADVLLPLHGLPPTCSPHFLIPSSPPQHPNDFFPPISLTSRVSLTSRDSLTSFLTARSNSVTHYQGSRGCCNWPGIGLEMSRKDLFPCATSLGANFAIGWWIMVPAHNGREFLIRIRGCNWVEGILNH